MPQDELWATSARCVGMSIGLRDGEGPHYGDTVLSLSPMWSKRPSGRNGYTELVLPGYMRHDLKEVVGAALEVWMYSDMKLLPGVVRSTVRGVQLGYQEGARG